MPPYVLQALQDSLSDVAKKLKSAQELQADVKVITAELKTVNVNIADLKTEQVMACVKCPLLLGYVPFSVCRLIMQLGPCERSFDCQHKKQ
jgi:hypothetical protein